MCMSSLGRVQVWRLMRKKRCRPNAIHYNLLLRAVRDCGVGSEEHINELLLPIPQSFTRRHVIFSTVLERKRLPGHRIVQSSKRVTFCICF